MSVNPPKAKPHDDDCRQCWRVSYWLERQTVFQPTWLAVPGRPVGCSMVAASSPPERGADDRISILPALGSHSVRSFGLRSTLRLAKFDRNWPMLVEPLANFEKKLTNVGKTRWNQVQNRRKFDQNQSNLANMCQHRPRISQIWSDSETPWPDVGPHRSTSVKRGQTRPEKSRSCPSQEYCYIVASMSRVSQIL